MTFRSSRNDGTAICELHLPTSAEDAAGAAEIRRQRQEGTNEDLGARVEGKIRLHASVASNNVVVLATRVKVNRGNVEARRVGSGGRARPPVASVDVPVAPIFIRVGHDSLTRRTNIVADRVDELRRKVPERVGCLSQVADLLEELNTKRYTHRRSAERSADRGASAPTQHGKGRKERAEHRGRAIIDAGAKRTALAARCGEGGRRGRRGGGAMVAPGRGELSRRRLHAVTRYMRNK